MPMSHPMYDGPARPQRRVLAACSRTAPAAVHLSVGGQTESVNGDLVSGNFFQVLGVRPPLGRLFTRRGRPRRPARHPVVVLGHGFWKRRFAATRRSSGSTVSVNSHPMTIVGVGAAGFHGIEVGAPSTSSCPLAMQEQVHAHLGRGLGDWRSRWLTSMARLKDGVSLAAGAGRRANVLYAQLLQEDCAHDQGRLGAVPDARSSQKTLDAAAGRARHLGSARPVEDAAARADGHGRPGAADRLRQRGQPAAGARLVAPEGDRGAAGPGRRAAAGSCASSWWRACCSSLAGGSLGLVVRRPGRATLLLRALPFERRGARAVAPTPTCAWACFALGLSLAHRHRLRARAGDAVDAARRSPRAQERGGGGDRRHRGLPLAQGPGGGAGGAVAAAAHRAPASSRAA